MDRQPLSSQPRPIRRPLYGRVGSIPPGGVTLVTPSPVVAPVPPPARAPSPPATQLLPTSRSAREMTPPGAQMPPATQLLPTNRSAREMTPPGTQMPPARSQVQRSEPTAPTLTLAPSSSGAFPAPPEGPSQVQTSTPDSPVTIKANTVTRPPTPAATSRSAIAHPVPEPNSPAAEMNKPSANGSSNTANGGAVGRGLSRRFSGSSHTPPPTPPSPQSGPDEEIKKSFPEEQPTRKNSAGSVAAEKASGGSAAGLAGFGILTLAGENTGAYMELANGGRDWRGDAVDGRGRSQNGAADGRAHRIPADQGVWAQRRGTNGDSRSGGGNGRKLQGEEQSSQGLYRNCRPMSAVVNSNVQAVNNSVLCQSTFSHGSPGVHVAFSRGNNHRQLRRNGVHHTAAAPTAGSRS